MDITMDIEVEHQITQPEQELTIMETCCEDPQWRRLTQQKKFR